MEELMKSDRLVEVEIKLQKVMSEEQAEQVEAFFGDEEKIQYIVDMIGGIFDVGVGLGVSIRGGRV